MKTRSRALRTAATLSAAGIMALCTGHEAHAQRTMRDQNLLTVQMQTPCTGARHFGGSLTWGRYMLDAYWRTSVSVVPRGVALSTGHDMDVLGVRAGGAYMHRLASVRSRAFSLYGGCGAFIGYELYDPAGRLPGNIVTGLGDGAFIYGIDPGIEAEVFLSRRLAFTAGCTMPLTFGSVSRWLRINATAGLRLNI